MTTQNGVYDDVQEGRPRVVSYDDHGVRTTTTTTRLGPDPTEKPRETVSVRTVQHPDATETITVTEKKLPPIRYTETITREKGPKKVQIARNAVAAGPATEVLRSISIPPSANEIPPNPKAYSVVRRERIVDEPNTVVYPSTGPDRFIVTQTDRLNTPRTVIRQGPEQTTTIIRQPTPTSYIQVPNNRTTRIVEVRQPPSPVRLDLGTPPLTTTTKKTTIINDNTHDTLIDDRRTLVNYQDNYSSTRRVGRRSDLCGNCGMDCCGCDCFDDCCGTTNCCRTNSFAQRKDVTSYRTRVTKDGRRVRYRSVDAPGYRCCNCCTGWWSRVCPCCSCLEWFCACPCWLWLCCLLPLLLGLLGLSIGLLTQLPSIVSNNNNNNNNNNLETLRVIKQETNETWYVYGSDQPCSGSATTFPPSISTITPLIPCAVATTSWARIIQATTLITISGRAETFVPNDFLLIFLLAINSNTNTNTNRFNELRVTQSYNTVLAVLGQNAPCQPDRNLPGVPIYCDQSTTRFTVSATASSSTVFAIAVNGSAYLALDYFLLFILFFLSFLFEKTFHYLVYSIFEHVI